MKIGAVMFFTADSMQPAALGRALEGGGFESFWVPEHTHVPSTRLSDYPGGGALPRPYYDIYDPFLALNTAAAVTTTLKIGTGIALVVQRDPIVTAKAVSSIDQLSQGRIWFGVGNGWNRDDVENHGTAFGTRNKLARERIEAMQTIWTQDEPSYEGEFVKFGPMSQWPKPFQKPYPPIIVGGAFPHAAHHDFPGARRSGEIAVLPGDRDRPRRVQPAGGEGGCNYAYPGSLGPGEARSEGVTDAAPDRLPAADPRSDH